MLEEGLVDRTTIHKALINQEKTGRLIGHILIEMGAVTEEQVANTLVQQYGIPFLRGEFYRINDKVKKMFPIQMMKKYDFVPLDVIGKVIIILTSGLPDDEFFDQVEKISGRMVHIFIGTLSEVTRLIDEKFEETSKDELSNLGKMLLGNLDEDTDH